MMGEYDMYLGTPLTILWSGQSLEFVVLPTAAKAGYFGSTCLYVELSRQYLRCMHNNPALRHPHSASQKLLGQSLVQQTD